jgi:chromosomal replication initiation ATPase DnaA
MTPAADGKYRFQNFVVGSANRLAVSAARAVAQSPGSAYNPLFIYSASGLGKTHLLLATVQLATELQPGLSARYMAAGEFIDELHAAVAAGRAAAFKEQFAGADMLLLDDVQFVAGKRETQAELLRVFDTLQRGRRQIILASDRPPAEISDLDEQLITRFSGGLIVDIDAPDYETRVAILKRKCDEHGARFPAGVIEAVARMGQRNVRELEGALTRLVAFEQFGEGQVVPASVQQILRDRAPTPIATEPIAADEFSAFVSDLAVAVSEHFENNRRKVDEAIAAWQSEGYDTSMLENAAESEDPEGRIAQYEQAVERLRELEQNAAAADPALAGDGVFRDPSRVDLAEAAVREALDRLSREAPPPGPVAVFTRESYEVGPCNQFAVHAGEAVSREPGKRYSPLMIHGGSGVGKSHLLHWIGNELGRGLPGGRVACVKTQLFVDELIAALEEGTIERWRARWSRVDALLLDDVNIIAGTERAQEELFHLFNALHDDGRQIVFTADRPPRALEQLEDRLRSRFEGGLVVEIRPPDSTLRQKLYRKLLQQLGVEPAADLLSYLSQRPAPDIRTIQDVADRLATAANGRSSVTLSVARRTLDDQALPAGATAPGADLAGDMDGFFLDREKSVWDWPELGGRAIEEIR